MEDFAFGFAGIAAASIYGAWAERREGGENRDIALMLICSALCAAFGIYLYIG